MRCQQAHRQLRCAFAMMQHGDSPAALRKRIGASRAREACADYYDIDSILRRIYAGYLLKMLKKSRV